MSKLVELRDIHFAYPHAEPVLKGVDFDLEAGERIAITGPNGAGKSTLFHILVGLNKPQKGEVKIFDRVRTQEKDFFDVRQKIGLVFQDPDDQLFCPTVQEDIAFGLFNLGLSPDQVVSEVDDILKRLHLEHLRDRATHNLSGGEKRLVSLACVLVMKPEILLLDEPTNALDEQTQERLCDILNSLPQAMVLISHDPHFRRRITTQSLNLSEGCLHKKQPKCSHAQ